MFVEHLPFRWFYFAFGIEAGALAMFFSEVLWVCVLIAKQSSLDAVFSVSLLVYVNSEQRGTDVAL